MRRKGLVYEALHWFIGGAVTKCRVGGPKPDIYFLTFLEAASPRPRCWQLDSPEASLSHHRVLTGPFPCASTSREPLPLSMDTSHIGFGPHP